MFYYINGDERYFPAGPLEPVKVEVGEPEQKPLPVKLEPSEPLLSIKAEPQDNLVLIKKEPTED